MTLEAGHTDVGALTISVDVENSNGPQRDCVSRGEKSAMGQTVENPTYRWWWRKRSLKTRLGKKNNQRGGG